MMTWAEALETRVGHTAIGYEVRSMDPLWVVVTLFESEANEDGPAGQEMAYWCGDYWFLDWADPMHIYTHKEAVAEAARVTAWLKDEHNSDRCAYAISLGDLCRDEDRYMAELFKDYPRTRIGRLHKTSSDTLAALHAQGWRG